MKRKVLYLLSLLIINSTLHANETNITASCEDLGYKTLYNDCLNASGTPLLCPFYTADKKLTACLKDSCRGYSLTDEDLDATASDGQTYRAHAKSISSCTVGNGNDAVVYYRVDECKEGSRYQDGLCDVGCSVDRYPYTEHQGNLAGDMRSCVESSGERFGYYECNDGWTGGWKTTGIGKCELNKCSITDYPYPSDPNLEENRGFTLSCKIGGNTYYKYSNVDKNGNTLTSNSCNTNGHTLNGGVCSKRCDISNCTATVKNITNGEYVYSYNEWKCKLNTNKCRIGDHAYIDGANIGIIVHLPDADDNRMHVISTSVVAGRTANDAGAVVNISLLRDYGGEAMRNDADGKYNCKTILAYSEKNPQYVYPLISSINNFTPNNCKSAICGAGEWYSHAGKELFYLFDNRYVIYNVTYQHNFIGDGICSSTEYGAQYMSGVYFQGASSIYYAPLKKSHYGTNPMLSFTLK